MARPSMPSGYSICNFTPNNVTKTGAGEEDFALQTSFPDWTVVEYVGDDDDFLYYYFISQTGSDTFWAWPDEVACTSSGSSKAPTTDTNALKVKEVQKKLNANFQKHIYYPLAIDGKWGPKTCFAAYGYQKSAVGYGGGTLLGSFFTKLGLPEVWTTHFSNACASWYGDVPGEKKEEVIVPPVAPSAPFPWKEMLIGAAGGSLIGLAGKKTLLKKSRVKTWQAGVGGAVLGALGGFIAGKVRG